MVLATDDGGATWRQQKAAASRINSVAFADARRGWMVGVKESEYSSEGVILATVDGGRTWRRQNPGTSGELLDVTFADTRHGWAVGRREPDNPMSGGVIVATTDGGRTWRRPKSGPVADQLDIARAVDASHCWVVGASYRRYTLHATADGGATWMTQPIKTGVAILDMGFSDASHGWVMTWAGGMFNTASGGFPTPARARRATPTPSAAKAGCARTGAGGG